MLHSLQSAMTCAAATMLFYSRAMPTPPPIDFARRHYAKLARILSPHGLGRPVNRYGLADTGHFRGSFSTAVISAAADAEQSRRRVRLDSSSRGTARF